MLLIHSSRFVCPSEKRRPQSQLSWCIVHACVLANWLSVVQFLFWCHKFLFLCILLPFIRLCDYCKWLDLPLAQCDILTYGWLVHQLVLWMISTVQFQDEAAMRLAEPSSKSSEYRPINVFVKFYSGLVLDSSLLACAYHRCVRVEFHFSHWWELDFWGDIIDLRPCIAN